MSLRELLKDKLQEEKLLLLPKGFEVIGDIAILNLPPSLYDEKHLIAQALVSHNKNVKVVLLKPGGIVHFYTFKKDFEISHFKRVLEELGWHIDFYRDCGSVAPRVSRYVFDLRKQ